MNSFVKLASLLLLIAISFAGIMAQNRNDLDKETLVPPAEEKFQETNDLALPWRESGCQNYYNAVQEPNCRKITPDEYKSSAVLSIYNEDGSLWYRFSIIWENPEHFKKNIKEGFLPFAVYSSVHQFPILRLVGESKHWYKVEINEETQETKHILKSDPMWAKKTWAYLLISMRHLKFIGEEQRLFDNPEGSVIEESANLKLLYPRVLKTEGDWAYVEEFGREKYHYGWIRWREGRKMLITARKLPFTITQNQKDIN